MILLGLPLYSVIYLTGLDFLLILAGFLQRTILQLIYFTEQQNIELSILYFGCGKFINSLLFCNQSFKPFVAKNLESKSDILTNYEAVEIMTTLSDKELKKLRFFIECRYFNCSKPVRKLFKILIKFAPTFDDPVLTTQFLISKMNSRNTNKPIEEGSLRNYFSDLTQSLLNFLFYNDLENISPYKIVFIGKELQVRNLIGLYDKEKTKFLEYLAKKSKDFSTLDLFHKYLFNLNDYNIESFNVFQIGNYNTRQTIVNHNLIATSLTDYYLLQSFRDWIDRQWQIYTVGSETILESKEALRTYFIDDEKTESLFLELIEMEENTSFKELFSIYYLLFQCYKTDESGNLKYGHDILLGFLIKLINNIKELFNLVNEYELQYIISISRNIINRFTKLYPQHKELKDEINEMYLKVFSNDITGIPHVTFSRIIFDVFLLYGDYDKAKNLIDNYMPFVYFNSKDRMDKNFYVTFLKLWKYLNEKKYSEAYTLFKTLKPLDIHIKRSLKYVEIMILFRLKDYVSVFESIEKFEQYSRDEKEVFSSRIRKEITDFCRPMKLVSRYMEKPSSKKFWELEKEINNIQNFFLEQVFTELKEIK